MAEIQDVVTHSSFCDIMVKVESIIFIPFCFGLINRKDFFENYHLHPHEPGNYSVYLRIFQFGPLSIISNKIIKANKNVWSYSNLVQKTDHYQGWAKFWKKRRYCTIRTILREYRALKNFWITQKVVRKISKNSIETHKTQNFGSEFGGGR